MANQYSSMSMNEFYRVWGPQIDAMSRKIGAKVNYDFSLMGGELADDAVARAWIAMPKMLKEYDSSVCPLLPYIGQRLNWLFQTEKRKNAKHAQREFVPADDTEGVTNSLERDADNEKYMLAERCESVKNALAALKKALPSGKHRDCLVAHIRQLKDESLEPAKMMNCTRQYVHKLKKSIPDQIDSRLSGEIRELLRRDDTSAVYAVKTVNKSVCS